MKSQLSNKEPEKSLCVALKSKAGRNFSGRITVRHQGGGVKKMYRIIEFGEGKIDQAGKVIALEYDPNRNGYLALVQYADGSKDYVLAADGIAKGSEIICAAEAPIKTGNRAMLKNIPIGTEVFNIELEKERAA